MGKKKSKNMLDYDLVETEKANVNIISQENEMVSEEVKKEEQKMPMGFVNIKIEKPAKENKVLIKNGRVYKDLHNGYGLYADTGEAFKL